jgi:hypothetical protein
MQPARQLLASTLRKFTDDQGRYDAVKIAQTFDWTQQELAWFLGKDKSAISKNPTSPGYQDALARLVALFDRIIELTGGDAAAAVAWLRTPILALDNAPPKTFILAGELEVVENLVHEYESGLAL